MRRVEAPPGISFVLPFWNEEEGVEHVLDTVARSGRQLVEDGTVSRVEVVAVDDGSTDATPEILRRLSADQPEVRVIHQAVNGGLAAALRAGFAAAREPWIFYTDGDLPVDPLLAGRALRAASLHDADIIACYRLDRTGEGLRRAVLSAGYNVAVRAVIGLPVRDVNFAAKLVRRTLVADDLPQCDSLLFDAELLARARRKGATILQIGVDYFPRTRGVSTLSAWPVITATARDLVRLGPALRSRT